MDIKIFTTGGTIDKVYFDAQSQFQIGDSTINEIFVEAGVTFSRDIESVLRKDSLELTDQDREAIRSRIAACGDKRILITHGTDTMVKTASVLKEFTDRTIVLTGAMQPARLRSTDAIFNVGYAVAATQLLPAGIYIAMNGRVFDADKVKKNWDAQRFEDC